jgi:hypothetical protein
MKRILVLAVAAVTLFTMMGCSKQDPNVAINDIMDGIKTQMTEDMIEAGVPEDRFVDGDIPGFMEVDLVGEEENPMAVAFESFNKEDLEEGAVLMQMMNIKSDLIFVLKAADESKVQVLKEALEEQKTKQEGIWSNYLIDQYEKVQNNVIKVNGKYLLYATCDHPENIEAIFDNALSSK